MNDAKTITNEMLYELIKEFKRDVYKRFEQIDKRFEQIDSRFEQIDKRFEQIDSRFYLQDKRMDEMQVNFNQRFEQIDKRFDQQDARTDRMEDDRREDRRLLRDIHESRHEVQVKFHWKLAVAGVATSTGVSVVVFLAMSSLMG